MSKVGNLTHLAFNLIKFTIMYPERFKKATDKLIKAYLNDTLQTGDCSACAVGNMCNGQRIWYASVINFREINTVSIRQIQKADALIKETGYSIEEINQIESTFEHTAGDNFNKLVAVFNLLCSFDNIEDSSSFIKALQPETIEL